MRKLSQKELLDEGFSDIVRGAASALKSAAEVALPGTSGALGRYKANINKVTGAFTKNQPVSFLKNKLKGNKNIEFVKFIKETKKQADINKPWYKRISGPKSVTLVEFIASVYLKGPTNRPLRGYRAYNTQDPTQSLSATGTAPSTTTAPPAPSHRILLPPLSGINLPPLSSISVTAPTPSLSAAPGTDEAANKILVAEIFRTNEGLEVGDIYDKETNQDYTEYVNKFGGGARNTSTSSSSSTSRKIKEKKFTDRAKERHKKGNLNNSNDLENFLIDIYDEFDKPADFAKYATLKTAIGSYTGINDLPNIITALKSLQLLENTQVDTLKDIILLKENLNMRVD